MGPRNHASLSEDTVSTGRHASGSKGRRRNHRKTGQEQTETDFDRNGWKARQRTEGSQVCRVFCPDAEGSQERVWRGDLGGIGAARAGQTQKVRHLVSWGGCEIYASILKKCKVWRRLN